MRMIFFIKKTFIVKIYYLFRRGNYYRKVLRFKRRSSYKTTVDMIFPEKFRSVFSIHRPPILNCSGFGHIIIIKLRNNSSDYTAYLICLFSGGGLSRSDSPYRFISYNYIFHIGRRNSHKSYFSLQGNDFLSYSLLSLL